MSTTQPKTVTVLTPTSLDGWMSLAQLIAQLTLQVAPIIVAIAHAADQPPHTTIQVGGANG